MNDRPSKTAALLANLRHPETWTSPGGGAIILGIVLSASLAVLAVLGDLSWRYKLLTLATIVGVGVLVWFVGRYWYWWSGRGRKVGICVDTITSPLTGWARMQSELARLVENEQLRERITIRYLYPGLIRTEVRWNKIQRRFKFSSILKLTTQPHSGAGSGFRLEGRTEAFRHLSRDFVQATFRHMGHLAFARYTKDHARQVLNIQTENLFEALLLHLAVIDCAEGRLKDAHRYLAVLESRLASKHPHAPIDQHPRLAIRWLDSVFLMSSSGYDAANLPHGEDLLEIVADGEQAVQRYGEQFPDLLNAQARNLFFVGDAPGALELTERALKLNLSSIGRMHATLNRGVLNLFLSNWITAAESFEKLFAATEYRKQDWKALVRFADAAASDFGEPHAIFIQCLYRCLAKQQVPVEMRKDLNQWLGSDPSKQRLRNVYSSVAREAPSNKARKRGRKSSRKHKRN